MVEEFGVWNERKEAIVRANWANHSASELVVLLKGEFSRNAIVGKAHRLGLAGKPSPIKRTPARQALWEKRKAGAETRAARAARQHTRRPGAPGRLKKKPRRMVEDHPAPANNVIAYVPKKSTARHPCRYPIGDPKEPGFHFCEAESKAWSPYCEAHHAICYQGRTYERAEGVDAADVVAPLARRKPGRPVKERAAE